ncbi:hypothetical protein EXIGLDRAFT_720016 [Exidia glandulosa HHB12029]|uniref:N-acetyl-D-glucosamine kinase n=1 Tax=Exidia glandulosa HHB12029 TaxID=1314781 RepID=A0A165NM46_EXIGL|nr:hypothetical protein EXIGLDRAFT_720016 [Exidia glandulosa HHB12029]
MSDSPSMYLCVDCGGSKTAAAIATKDGTVVGRGLGGPSNYTDVGLAKFVQSFSDAVANAYKAALGSGDAPELPLNSGVLQAAWIGVSGVDSPAAVAALTGALAPLLALPPSAPRLLVANDTHLLASPLRLHSDVSTAVVAIAGTGSIAVSFKLQEDGSLQELGRVGGWGWLLGDEGSGFYVGREAVREILTRADRAALTGEPAAPSTLRDKVFEIFEIENPYDVFSVIYAADPIPGIGATPAAKPILDKERKHRMAGLAPVVFECAFVEKDELALTVLQSSAGALARQISAMLKTENDASPAANAVLASSSILCLGGSLVSQEGYQNLLKEELAKFGHVFRYMQYVDDVTGLGAAGIASSA